MGRQAPPTLLKNLDSSSRSSGLYIGDGVRGWTLASIPAQEFSEWTSLGDDRSTTCCSSRQRRSRATSSPGDDELLSPKSTPLCNCHLALTPPVDNLLLFATTTGVRHVFTRVRLGTHPCSRTRRLDVLDVLDGAKATWVGRVRPFAIFFSLFCLQLSTRPAHIPAQEFGRWTTPFSRDSIARLKSTPLCDIPFLPSPARVSCCSSRRRGRGRVRVILRPATRAARASMAVQSQVPRERVAHDARVEARSCP